MILRDDGTYQYLDGCLGLVLGRTQGVVIIGHNIGEGIRDVPACDNLLGFVSFIRELKRNPSMSG